MSAAAHAFSPFIVPAPAASAWLTQAQVLKATSWSDRWLRAQAKTGNVMTRQSDKRGANGKPIVLYLAASLPPEAQAKLESPIKPIREASASVPTGGGGLFPETTGETPNSEAGQRISLSPAAERQAAERLGAIQALLDFAEPANRAKYAALKLRDGRKVTTAVLMAEYIAETVTVEGKAVSRPTLFRWAAAFREGGLQALARKTRDDRGTSHFFTRYPAAATLAIAEYHKPFATVARAYDAINRDQRLLQIADEDLPSYETVRRYLEAQPMPMRVFAREGQRKYNEMCAPYVQRAYVDIPANDVWVADHMIHDVEVRNDCFAGVPQDAPMRLRMTAIMDMRSRKLLKPVWCAEGDSRSITTGFRRAVEAFGPPVVFYCDNGKDYKKATRGAVDLRRPEEAQIRAAADELARRGAIQRLGVQVQFCIPYHPQSKPIERAFRTVHLGLDAMMPHYTSGNAYSRPDQTIVAGADHRKLVRIGRGSESDLIPASLFIRLAETWIEQVYNATHKHDGKGMDGRTPNEVFDEGYPVETRRSVDPDVLATLLYERRTAKVMNTAVTIDKRRYMPLRSSVESWGSLHNANGRTVVIAFDPLDPSRAIALDDRDCKLADLELETLTTQSPAAGPQIADTIQIGGRLRKATGIAIANIHRTVAQAGHKSDLQHLAELAAVQQPVDDLVSQRIIRRATRPSDTAHAPASSFDIAQELLGDLFE